MWQDFTMKTFPQFKQSMKKKKLTLNLKSTYNLVNLLINFFLNYTAYHNMCPKLPRLA